VYGVQTNNAYWSVVATRGSQGYDTDLNLHGSPANRCNKLGTSLDGSDAPTDWVAWDNNGGRYPIGPYVADIFEHAGGPPQILQPKYLAQFVRGSQTLSTISPLTWQPVGHPPQWIVDIRDVLLYAGTTYTFTVIGGVSGVYLLHSDTANSATWAQGRNTSTPFLYWSPNLADFFTVSHYGTFTVTPTQTSWYGALFVCDGWWGVPTSVNISAS